MVKLWQCGGGVVLRWSRSTGSFCSSFVIRRFSFARTLQGYISAHIFFVGAPVVYVNIVICPSSISKYLCAIIVIWPDSIRKYFYLAR